MDQGLLIWLSIDQISWKSRHVESVTRWSDYYGNSPAISAHHSVLEGRNHTMLRWWAAGSLWTALSSLSRSHPPSVSYLGRLIEKSSSCSTYYIIKCRIFRISFSIVVCLRFSSMPFLVISFSSLVSGLNLASNGRMPGSWEDFQCLHPSKGVL